MNDSLATPQRLLEIATDPGTPDRLASYFRPATQTDTDGYSGRFFEQWLDRTQPNAFTPSDFLAVSALSVEVPPKAAAWILSDHEFAELLAKLPNDRSLHDLDSAAFDEVLCPMNSLNTRLRDVNGIGPTTSSKLMAAKRPHLVPVWDSVVHEVLTPPKGQFWRAIHEALASTEEVYEGRTLLGVLTDLRLSLLGQPGTPKDVSILRVLDVAVWMYGRASLHKQPRPAN